MKLVTNRIFFGTPKNTKVAESTQAQVKTASVKEAAFPKGHEDKFKANSEKLRNKANPAVAKEEEGKACEASKEVEIKIAEEKEKGVEKYDAGKKEGTEFANDSEKKPEDVKPADEKNAGKAATTTTKTQDGTFPSSGQPQWEGKPENNNKPEMPTDKNTQASADDLLKSVLAQLAKPFEKTANLKPEVKKNTKDYWRALFGEAYADAMVADK